MEGDPRRRILTDRSPGVRLVATDLDGTLLRQDGSLSGRVLAALRALDNFGVVIVLVSARNWRSVSVVAQQAQVSGLAICSNGAVVYNPAEGCVTEAVTVRPSVIRAFMVRCRSLVGDRVCFGWETILDAYGDTGFHELGPSMLHDYRGTCQVANEVAESHEVTKVGVGHPDFDATALLARIAPVVGEDLTATTAGGPLVVLTPRGATKATALARMCEGLGIRADQVLAIGDQPSDLPMLSWAGRGVAMANSHPAVLAAAREVTTTNEEDGVAVVLESLLR